MITLKTLPQATAQQVFDQVVNHLLTQNARSTGEKFCLYRDKIHSLKCAAGCLIGDDEYKEEFEGKTWLRLHKQGAVPLEHLALILELQGIHDNFPSASWAIKLREFAKIHGFSFNEGQNDNT